MKPSITFIGAGNMAQALIGGLLRNHHPASRLIAADPSADIREHIQGQFSIRTLADNAKAVAQADAVVLAVKPQIMDRVLESISDTIEPQALVISVAAGIPVQRLKEKLGAEFGIVRVMPNTPALIGFGATGLFADRGCNQAQRELAIDIFHAVGEVARIEDESLMDAVTAVSGSGPAYFFALTEALTEAGINAGLPVETARLLAQQTAAGAGAMLSQPGADAATLRERVTSPGGTTAAALDAFAKRDLTTVVAEAVEAAISRGRELASQTSEAAARSAK
ncbi:MAG: pyrroline-5-carboxylate reductase [Pseudomonadota bacterium]